MNRGSTLLNTNANVSHRASTKWTGDEWPNVWNTSQVPGEKKHKYQGNHTKDLDTGYKKQKGTRGQLHISSKSTLWRDMRWHIKTLGKSLKPFWRMHQPHKFTIKHTWKVYWIKDMYDSMNNTITHSFFYLNLLFRNNKKYPNQGWDEASSMPNPFNKVLPVRFLPYQDKAFPVRFPVLIRQISEALSVLQLKASTLQVLYKFPVTRGSCQ